MKRTFLLLATLVLPDVLLAQTHPNLARGFEPGKAYMVGDLDVVNLFNGGLSLTVPLGPSFPVGGGFSYSFRLTYSSQVWDHTFEIYTSCQYPYGDSRVAVAEPTWRSNAGLGWRFGFGDLLAPATVGNEGPTWTYLSPDGAEHRFYQTLHEGENDGDASVLYTRDNTYL